MINIEDTKKKRIAFLRTFYEETGGGDRRNANFTILDIGEKLGFTVEETEKIAHYLHDESLIEILTFNGNIRITQAGIHEIEDTVSHADTTTAHYPANIMQIGQMFDSQISQASPSATQSNRVKDRHEGFTALELSANDAKETEGKSEKISKLPSLSEKDLLSSLATEASGCNHELESKPLQSSIDYPLSEVQIFLSYAKQDRQKVSKLYDFLAAQGFNPWMDKKNLLPGMKWRPTIEKAIHDSDFFVACTSHNSVNRRGFLQKEIKIALDILDQMLDEDIYLIPARLEDCEIPRQLSVELQWADLYEPDGCNQLVQAIYFGIEKRSIGVSEGRRK
jgi:TIR domain